MPGLIRRRGNPWRDINGQFCSRRVGQITNVARAAGLTSEEGGLVYRFVCVVDESGMSIQEVQSLSQTAILDLCGASPWTARRCRQRTTRIVTLEAIDGIAAALGTWRPVSAESGRAALQRLSSSEILENPEALGNVLNFMGLHLHRIATGGTATPTCYWLETPDGDRFGLRSDHMESLFGWYQDSSPTAENLRSWLDDWAYEVDFSEDRLVNLMDAAQYLGIPNYERGSNRPQVELDMYTNADITALDGYVTLWQESCDQTRNRLGQAREQDCHCPECQFACYQISFGEYRQLRNHTDNPGALAVTPNSPRTLRVVSPTRREGFYNDRGDWVVGRQPAAFTRVNGESRSYDYDGFLSPENFEGDELDDEDRESYNSAAQYGIQAWNYKAPLEFFGEGNLYFGFENEINAPYPTASIPNAVDYIGTVKWDGSVDGGYEIVSQPMSLDYIHEMDLSWVPELRDAGARAGRNGLHVHISRDGFASDWHRAKFVKLWMEPTNYVEVKAFNRRHNTEYAAPHSRLTTYRMARRIAVSDGSRYCMVNVQNRETIEMRGPASTLNRIKLKGTLVGFAASVEYTRIMSMQQVALGGLQWSGFVQWASERPEYAEFMRYLEVLVLEGAPAEVYPLHARELVNA